MHTFQQQKEQVLHLFESALMLIKKYGNKKSEQYLYEAQKQLVEGKLFVLVCGEFKQGKSSLINAFLSEPGFFPVDVDITTCLVSTITYGEKEKITLLTGEHGKEKEKQIERREIADYVTEQKNKDNKKQARMLIIESPNPQLKNGLVLVDTPGLGSLNIQHTEITYAFIPNANAIVFVSDALRPLSSEEMEYIKLIDRHCKNIIFVLTKIDAQREYRTTIENNKDKLVKILGRTNNEINLIPVSSQTRLDYLKSKDPEDLEDSNFEALETEIWKLLTKDRGHILLTHALSEIGRAAGETKKPIMAQWETYQQRSKQELDDMENKFLETKNRLRDLMDNNADWRYQLRDGLEDVRIEMQELFQENFRKVRFQADNYMDNERLLNNSEQIVGLLEVDIDGIMSDLGKQLSARAANLHARVEDFTGLHINPFEVGQLTRKKAEPVTLPPAKKSAKKQGLWEKTINVTRNGIFSSNAGSTIGGLLGGVAGAVIGTLFGGVGAIPGAVVGYGIGAGLGELGGLATGARQGIKQMKEKNLSAAKHEVFRVIIPYIDDSLRICTNTLNKTLKKLERSMRDELERQIQREKDGCENTLTSIQKSRKLSQQQAAQKSSELKIPLEQLDRLLKEVEEMTKNVLQWDLSEESLEEMNVTSTQNQSKGADYGQWADA